MNCVAPAITRDTLPHKPCKAEKQPFKNKKTEFQSKESCLSIATCFNAGFLIRKTFAKTDIKYEEFIKIGIVIGVATSISIRLYLVDLVSPSV